MSASDVNRVVLAYLKHQGFASAHDKLQEELKRAKDVGGGGAAAVAGASVGGGGGVLTSSVQEFAVRQGGSMTRAQVGDVVLHWGLLQGDPVNIEKALSTLMDWITDSLPAYRMELQSVAFPVFAHCYLDLVEKGCGTREAARMMNTWGRDHREHFERQVAALRIVTAPEHIATSEVCQQILTHRFRISLCQHSFELLNTFLVNSRLLLISSILNRCMSVVVVDRPPRNFFEPAVCGSWEGAGAQQQQQHHGGGGGAAAAPPVVIPGGGSAEHVSQEPPPKVVWGAPPSDEVAHLLASAAAAKPSSGARAAVAGGGGAGGDAAAAAATAAGGAQLKPLPVSALPRMSKLPFLNSPFHSDLLHKVVLRPLHPSVLQQAAVANGPAKGLLTAAVAPPPSQGGGEEGGGGGGGGGGAPAAKRRRQQQQPFLADPSAPSVLMATFLNTHGTLNCVELTPDGTVAAAGFDDHRCRVWHLDSGSVEGGGGGGGGGGDGSSSGDGVSGSREVDDGPLSLTGHCKPVYAVSWSPEKRHLLTASGDGDVRLWDVGGRPRGVGSSSSSSGHMGSSGGGRRGLSHSLVTYRGHCCPVWDVSFSPVGYYFATAAADRTVRLWSTDTGQALRLMVGHLSDVNAVTFHPNCNYLLSGGDDNTLRLWDVQTGEYVRTFTGTSAPVCSLALCPTSRHVAAGSTDGTIRVWDIASGRPTALMKGHGDRVEQLDFSVEGSTLASGGTDGLVMTWDINQLKKAGSSSSSSSGSGGAGVAGVVGGTGWREEQRVLGASHVFATKDTAVHSLRWSANNLLLAAGAFHVEAKAGAGAGAVAGVGEGRFQRYGLG